MPRRFSGAGLARRGGRGAHSPPGAGGGAPAAPFLLDELTSTIHGAYSLSDQLSSTYDGPLFRVERQDTTQFDVEISGRRANVAALEAFLAGTNGYVCGVYDQGAGELHLTQATRANMPLIAPSGVVDVRGALDSPVMFFSPVDFQNSKFLRRAGSFGLTGNPGISVWFDWETETTGIHDDGFVWSVGNGPGAQYGTMRSWNAGDTIHRAISSTMAGNKTFLDPDDEIWGYLQHLWANGGDVDAATITRGSTALTSDSEFNETTSPTLASGYITLGASSRSDGWFGANGRASTFLFLGPTNPAEDVAIIRAHFDARL